MRIIIKNSIFIGLLGLFALPLLVFAQDVFEVLGDITNVLNAIIPILLLLALVVFLWGVFRYVTSGDSEDKAKARDLMIYGIIALFVMVSVWGLVNVLVATFGLSVTAPPAPVSPVP